MTLVDTATAAAACGVAPATIRQWVKRGKLTARGRIGRQLAFALVDIGSLDRHQE